MGSYVPNTKEQRQEMLKEIGFQTIDDLFAHIPAEVKIQGGLNIPEGKTELEVRRDMENIAAKNQVFKTIFRGAGAYRHFIPATVKSVISKENLLTAYTPYQAEISQGILQSIFEYQTMICDLTGMDISNACVYDGAEASAENVANDTYKVSRPFNIITTDSLSDAAQDFENYIMSSDGQQIVEDNGYIKVADDAAAYEQSDAEGKVVVAGSSSVTPVMEKLKEAYEKANGGKITVEVQQSDSTTGITSAAEGICDIGMASRDLKDEETSENLTATEIARDGIAVVVNTSNDIDDLTSDQVKSIFTGETTTWEDLAK